MDPSMDLSIDHQAEATHLTLHIIPEQITETTATQVTTTHTTHTTDKATTETTTGREATNKTKDMNRETKTTKTGMITIKIEIGLTTEGDRTNTNTTEINTKHRSSSSSWTRT